jgi:predicted permease
LSAVPLLLSILSTDIVPIFLIAGAGFVLARTLRVEARSLTQVVFHALLPCFVFRALVSATITPSQAGRLVLLAVLVMGTTGAVGYVIARALRLGRAELSAFLLVVMFSNGGNYGLPVVSFAFGAPAMSGATVYFLTGSVMTYTVGGFLAAAGNRRAGLALLGVLKMPALYGVASALVVLWLGTTVPTPISRAVDMLADSALPLMILILGMQLERAVKPERPALVAIAVLLSLVVTPLMALGFASLLHVSGPARQAAVVLASMPVAVTTSILAMKFDATPDFVMSAIFLSTVLSPLTLTPIIAVLVR